MTQEEQKLSKAGGEKYSGLDFIHLVPQVHVIYKNVSVNSTNTSYNAFSESDSQDLGNILPFQLESEVGE